jgi:putative oxidoreductase
MGETTVSHARTSPNTSRSRGLNITIWVLQVFLALQFVAAGLAKLGGSDAMVDMFNDIGAGQWLRYLVGTLELAGAAGLLIPVLSGLAGLCLCALMVGATFTNAVILEDQVWVPLGVLIVSVLVAWARWPKTKALIARVSAA